MKSIPQHLRERADSAHPYAVTPIESATLYDAAELIEHQARENTRLREAIWWLILAGVSAILTSFV